jgi:hypothetical protein
MSQDLDQNQEPNVAKVQANWDDREQVLTRTVLESAIKRVRERDKAAGPDYSVRASYSILGLFLALFLSSCASGPYNPLSGPSQELIKFQCYDQATGKWEDCPEILDEDM